MDELTTHFSGKLIRLTLPYSPSERVIRAFHALSSITLEAEMIVTSILFSIYNRQEMDKTIDCLLWLTPIGNDLSLTDSYDRYDLALSYNRFIEFDNYLRLVYQDIHDQLAEILLWNTSYDPITSIYLQHTRVCFNAQSLTVVYMSDPTREKRWTYHQEQSSPYAPVI